MALYARYNCVCCVAVYFYVAFAFLLPCIRRIRAHGNWMLFLYWIQIAVWILVAIPITGAIAAMMCDKYSEEWIHNWGPFGHPRGCEFDDGRVWDMYWSGYWAARAVPLSRLPVFMMGCLAAAHRKRDGNNSRRDAAEDTIREQTKFAVVGKIASFLCNFFTLRCVFRSGGNSKSWRARSNCKQQLSNACLFVRIFLVSPSCMMLARAVYVTAYFIAITIFTVLEKTSSSSYAWMYRQFPEAFAPALQLALILSLTREQSDDGGRSAVGKFLCLKPIQTLGEMSMSFYMTHRLVFIVALICSSWLLSVPDSSWVAEPTSAGICAADGPRSITITTEPPFQCNFTHQCHFPGCDQPDNVVCVDHTCYTGTLDVRCNGQQNGHIVDDEGWCWDGRREQKCPNPPPSAATSIPQPWHCNTTDQCRYSDCHLAHQLVCIEGICYGGELDARCIDQPNGNSVEGDGWCWEDNLTSIYASASIFVSSSRPGGARGSANVEPPPPAPLRCNSTDQCQYSGCDHPDMVACTEHSCYTGAFDIRCSNKTNGHTLGDGGWCWDGRRDQLCPHPPIRSSSNHNDINSSSITNKTGNSSLGIWWRQCLDLDPEVDETTPQGDRIFLYGCAPPTTFADAEQFCAQRCVKTYAHTYTVSQVLRCAS